MLHGHAKIELTNVKTGEKQVIEHDNYMTNWIKDMFTPRGIYGRSLQRKGPITYGSVSSKSKFTKAELFGGVMLFEEPLTANAPDDYKFPPANKCVARAWEQAYAGTDLSVGFFNSGLSSMDKEHATFVWDWTQERGNGTISALGLTNVWGARAGNGMDAIADAGIYVDMGVGGAIETGSLISQNRQVLFYPDMVDDVVYAVDTTLQNNKLRIYKLPLCYKNYNPITMDIVSNSSVTNDDASYYTYDDVDLTSYVGSNYPALNAGDDGYLWVTQYTASWASGTSKTFVKVNWKTKVCTTVSITNNTGLTLWANDVVPFIVHNGYLYAQSSASNRYVYISLADNTDCGVLKYSNGDEIVINGIGTGRFFNVWGDLYFGIAGSNLTYNNVSAPQLLILVDKGTAAWRNLRAFPYGYTYSAYANNAGGGNQAIDFYTFNDNNSWRRLASTMNFMCLSTKNNLDTPVTKTSDMTMRVTYTIQEASE